MIGPQNVTTKSFEFGPLALNSKRTCNFFFRINLSILFLVILSSYHTYYLSRSCLFCQLNGCSHQWTELTIKNCCQPQVPQCHMQMQSNASKTRLGRIKLALFLRPVGFLIFVILKIIIYS